MNLDPQQVKQAETQKAQADAAVKARIPETYQWLLVPAQEKPQDAIEWQAYKLSGQEDLALRASKKLRNDERLLTVFAGTRLRLELDRVPVREDERGRGHDLSRREAVHRVHLVRPPPPVLGEIDAEPAHGLVVTGDEGGEDRLEVGGNSETRFRRVGGQGSVHRWVSPGVVAGRSRFLTPAVED